jgi:hypothetical protein
VFQGYKGYKPIPVQIDVEKYRMRRETRTKLNKKEKRKKIESYLYMKIWKGPLPFLYLGYGP